MVRINQSLIKLVVDSHFRTLCCPRFVKEVVIGRIDDVSSIVKDRGKFFETLVLGSGAKGAQVFALPLAKGKPSVHEVRIRKQAEIAKRVFEERGIDISLSQTTLELPINDKYKMGGECDVYPCVFDSELAILDLKLTQNLDANYGMYAWGLRSTEEVKSEFDPMCDVVDIIPSEHDNLQANYYMIMASNPNTIAQNNGLVIPHISKEMVFVYAVFENQNTLRHRFFRHRLTPQDVVETRERLRLTIAELEKYEAEGWKERRGRDCKACPLTCKKRLT